ncbi:MAG: Lpg1974 family pore-forming outer membrane protein [Planctomycetaceae bacterium]
MKLNFRHFLAACVLAGTWGQAAEPGSTQSDFGPLTIVPTDVQYLPLELDVAQAPAVVPLTDSLRRPTIQQLQYEGESLTSGTQQVQYTPATEFVSSAPTYCPPAYCGEGCVSGCTEGCCQQKCGSCESAPRLFGSVEVPFLQPRISGAFPVFNVSPAADRLIEPDHTPSLRFQAEFRPEPTLGIRGRYFTFDSNSPFGNPFQPAEFGIRLDVADLEFVIHKASCRWNFDLSGGVQYSRLEYSATVPTAVGVGSVRFEGVGPVFAANAEHKLGSTSLAVFGGVRASYLMGETRNAALLVNVPRSTIHDEMMQVYQNQLGVVWRPQFFDQIGIAVKAGWETQFWLNDTFADDSYGIGSNLSLTGPMVSAEITF